MRERSSPVPRSRDSGTALLLATALLLVPAGCGSQPRRTRSDPATHPHLLSPMTDDELDAVCYPPPAWRPEPIERLPRSVQRVWVSPTGHTAYGVIRIRLPLPLGPDVVLWRFVAELRAREGEGRLLSRERNGGEIDFVAEGAQHRLTARLHTDGWKAWVIYAGVLRDGPVDPQEFPLAEAARDQTVTGATVPTEPR